MSRRRHSDPVWEADGMGKGSVRMFAKPLAAESTSRRWTAVEPLTSVDTNTGDRHRMA